MMEGIKRHKIITGTQQNELARMMNKTILERMRC